jgi:hypothetical protein
MPTEPAVVALPALPSKTWPARSAPSLGIVAQTFNPIYKAYELFLRALLRDERVRTQDPYEANLFYVPALT